MAQTIQICQDQVIFGYLDILNVWICHLSYPIVESNTTPLGRLAQRQVESAKKAQSDAAAKLAKLEVEQKAVGGGSRFRDLA